MITDSLSAIQERMEGFDAELIAVSKKQSDKKIEEALSCGLRTFGENRVQEAQERWTHRRETYPDLKLHLIGPLQSNKAKAACELFDVIHTVDREKIACEIVKHTLEIPCFIQVNTGDESQKAGISVTELEDFKNYCCNELGMNIIGLMCIPPINEPAGLHFGLLKTWTKKLNLQNLSMGMSDDFELALQCGATHIRVGSKLFGERQQA